MDPSFLNNFQQIADEILAKIAEGEDPVEFDPEFSAVPKQKPFQRISPHTVRNAKVLSQTNQVRPDKPHSGEYAAGREVLPPEGEIKDLKGRNTFEEVRNRFFEMLQDLRTNHPETLQALKGISNTELNDALIEFTKRSKEI